MLLKYFLAIFFGALMSIMLPCSAFIPDRSVSIPAAWNLAPSLEIEPKVTVNHASSLKTEVTGLDKDLQISNTKISTGTVEQTSPVDVTREKRSDFTVESIDNDPRFPKIKDANLVKENAAVEIITSTPRNIIIIIAEPGQDQQNFWKSFRTSHSFPVEGMLQSYNNAETGQVRFPLDAALVSGNRDNCEHILRSNIAALLDWCRDVKGMTTGTLSNANFTIPTLFGYEEFVGHSREFDDIDENNMKPEVRKLKREIHGDWHVIDLGKSSNRIPSFVPGQNSRETDEAVWNVFDSLSKLKLLLTQSLLESLGGNVATSEDAIPSIKSHPLRSNVVDIIEELKSVENEKGFILAASLPAFELNSALDFLQHEGSEDTLLVVIGVCSHDSKPVPFFAQGPSSKMLREAIAVWNVPAVINTIIANGCQDCKISRHDLLSHQAAALNIVPHNVADLRRTPRGAITKRNDDKKVDSAMRKEEVKKVADLNAKEEVLKDNEKDASPKAEDSNSANFNMAEKFTMIFGTIISLATTFALTS